MSSRSRIGPLLIVVAAILTIGPASAQDSPAGKPSEQSGKASGNWTDPPAKPATPPTNAAAPTRDKVDEAAAPIRTAAKPVRRSAKLRRQALRRVASRTERPVRVQASHTIRRPSRRLAAVSPSRPANWSVVRGRPRPVYGYIAPDAPAEAYYTRRYFGTIGSGPAGLGLPPDATPFDDFAEVPASGRLIVRWRGGAVPAGYAEGRLPPPDAFDPN
ncbi:hypothetical protein [Methylorubrum populi]|uniref:Uncharacterized protein n=1 Tax=Methylorubrum populi TaxID=223967 RepID=A0A921E6B3_9HYPH|nr:hypothetical protein [Methylorubrum populi]